ncbi:MAG: hypothetical protein Q9227_002703 [Pyrenula ochraceoflavens]
MKTSPFLSFVSNTDEFDTQLENYVKNGYVQQKYQNLLGCDNVNLANTSSYYARYTTSIIYSCSEEMIALNNQLCRSPGPNFIDQIRADLTNCALPADSLSGQCIPAEQNEPRECGYGTSLQGLCSFCGASSPNATDSCCINSNATGRCAGVTLPAFSSIPPLQTSSSASPSSTSRPSSTAEASSHSGLSGGQIAGIVIGAVFGALLLLGLLILCCTILRRRRRRRRSGTAVTPMQQYSPVNNNERAFHVTPGGRVARMDAMENNDTSAYAAGGAGMLDRRYDNSDSDQYGDSPESGARNKPPAIIKRNGSLSSNSVLAGDSPQSGQMSSPEGLQSGQSEQLSSFQDYYSADPIRPNDKVSVLWAYSPRAGDEFELARGDMLKVVGIWDDGWATGVRISDRAEDYESKHKVQRDSGMSNGSTRGQSPPPPGEIKAFPLVCVCLPDAWRKTVEGDTSTESGEGGPTS